MSATSEARILALWEAAADRPPLLRTLALAAAGAQQADVADLTIGARDRHLLALRQECFGPTLACLVDCPSCGTELEMELSIADLAVEDVDDDREAVHLGDIKIEFRAITSRDLLAIAGSSRAARRDLIARCVTTSLPDDTQSLPESVLDQMSAALAALDPQADIHVEADCAVCDHRWNAPFDIAGYLWSEVNAEAVRILHDVHELAMVYGWSENDVLAVSPARRRRYLEMATP
ncbi:hypothetical protein MJO55_06050 [Mycolicibacterium rufum]|uniref:Phage baseplate protein n=1 Tax=Mycolicibacterium rufum TaxID=318424 RepID=A0ABY3UFC9_9MYCO|nr:hypothetical protein [Mycolicibacterium rufum]KGI67121.1 hypothetical protein EU78_06225 [Mycolicibacterium rufum]ULP37988.1 hypothetical protein MJO55_06050 [Mycolicibacterium rufum]